MLKVPKLDDITYEQMIQRAVSRIPAMTDEWTDFNSHDPGITVLQTYAWLTDMLNYYMNATGDIHVQKYLKLLGIGPEQARAAEGYVVLEHMGEPVDIPAGTRFYAGDIPFETEEGQRCCSNEFCSFISESDGQGMDLTPFAGRDGDYAEGFSWNFQKASILYFGFEKALSAGDRLYVCIDENIDRNPFGSDFRLCSLDWQYRGRNGWESLEVLDGTGGFLKSGFIELITMGEMEIWQHPEGAGKAFYIRCVLTDNRYDSLPRIGMVYVNPLRLVQKQTVCQEGEFLPGLKLGKTNGCADQELEFDFPDAYDFSLALWSLDEKDEPCCELWRRTEELDQAGYEDKVFSFDPDRKVVRFGDGIHGAVPPQHMPVSVTGLVCSRLSRGNVLAGEITETDFPLPEGCTVTNPLPAFGGREREQVTQMLERMEECLFAQNRMASGRDYEERIQRTPGLRLELVHVIPGQVYGERYRQSHGINETVVVVKPRSSEKEAVLGDAYQEAIEKYLEPYRLLGTKVSVMSPKYVGIRVHGRIALYQDTPQVRREIEECIREETDYERRKEPFGARIAYGRLFTRLESLPGVRQVQELSLERMGSAAMKNERGDILLYEDALSYFRASDLEYC